MIRCTKTTMGNEDGATAYDLRRAAQGLAGPMPIDVEAFRHKVRVLHEHGAAVGRDP